jgi:hypothetical protein
MSDRIFINVPEMLGIDNDTYLRADGGDRQAQKAIVRALWTRDASPKALASPLPWTHWLLRVIGSGSRQTLADFWGVVDLQRRTGRLSATEADALDRLMEQFIGPGAVDAATAAEVRQVFATGEEGPVIELFLLHDRLASGDPTVSVEEIEAGVYLSEGLESDPGRVFFLGVWAQHAAQRGDLVRAIPAAEVALEMSAELAATDAEYQRRLGLTATLLRQLYGFMGDAAAIARIDRRFAVAIELLASQE